MTVVMEAPDAAALVEYEMSALPVEHLRVINLDTRNRVINIENIYVGSLNASTVRVGELFKPAIQRNAASIIVLHNHPSGDCEPSHEDIVLTNRLDESGKILGIRVLDHIIIGDGVYFSFKEEGLI